MGLLDEGQAKRRTRRDALSVPGYGRMLKPPMNLVGIILMQNSPLLGILKETRVLRAAVLGVTRMTFRLFRHVLPALAFVAALVTFAGPTSAVEFLFTREFYEREHREPVKGVAIYRRGVIGGRHDIETQRPRYRYRTRRVVVRPSYTTYRRNKSGRVVAHHHRAVTRRIRQRVLVSPVRYRAVKRPNRHGWVRGRAIVQGHGPFTKHFRPGR